LKTIKYMSMWGIDFVCNATFRLEFGTVPTVWDF
jgi:hypothetical protein